MTEHVNRIGIVKRDTTEAEIARLLACQLAEPCKRRTTSCWRCCRIVERIPADYPEMAAGRRKQRLFYLEVGQTADGERPSVAKQMAEIIDRRKERMIIDCLEALEAAE